MSFEELAKTMDALLHDDKGFLAADESESTIGKRFAAINIANNEQNRRDYRLLLATTPDLATYINGVILHEETFNQCDDQQKPIPVLFAEQGIVPGIKVDKGLVPLANTDHEQVTQGMDGLTERLVKFKELGARFAKWRNVYSISASTPSIAAIKTGAELLARYAATCQAVGIVPIIEPEVLMDGDHSIQDCADATEAVMHELFNALFDHQIALEFAILKPSMVTCGKNFKPFSSPEEIANYTINVFRNHVLAAIPSINFLSGGQTPQQATVNLNAINKVGIQPWLLSFSYGRALQEECLQAWGGVAANVKAAQQVLLKRARLNSAACRGEYQESMENAD